MDTGSLRPSPAAIGGTLSPRAGRGTGAQRQGEGCTLPYLRNATHPAAASISASMAIASGESAGIDAPTVVVTLAVLLAAFESGVVELIVTVFVVCVPAAVPSGTLKVNWNVALAPALNEAIVQTTGPVPLQLKAGPVVWLTETKVIPAGTVSVSVTVDAIDGPAFAAVTV